MLPASLVKRINNWQSFNYEFFLLAIERDENRDTLHEDVVERALFRCDCHPRGFHWNARFRGQAVDRPDYIASLPNSAGQTFGHLPIGGDESRRLRREVLHVRRTGE